ncbi:MAG: pilus assembly protein TadE [Actinobacteria bacterium]|nr:pilus assembly protein TadE [Actinomycetota bacterium]MCA1721017.1 pilus assembly protein TadE [Actinomycetota bacterium]
MPTGVPGRPRVARDAGMVTAETAVVLPVLLVVAAMAVWVLAAVAGQLRCVDAARAGARAAARGDAAPAVTEAARRIAPAPTHVRVSRSGDEVTVLVESVVVPFGHVLARLPGAHVAARATAVVEGP